MLIHSTRSLVGGLAILGCIAIGCTRDESSPDRASETTDGPVASGAGKEGSFSLPFPGAPDALDPSTTGVSGVVESKTGRYLVHFREKAVANQFGELRRLRKNVQGGPLGTRFNLAHPAIASYKSSLLATQASHLADIRALIGRNAESRRFTTAVNAAVLTIDLGEAQRVAQLDDVAFVEPDQELPLLTDRGPALVGAPAIWDGTATGGVASQGEGMVVGIIDTGIAFNVSLDGVLGAHPSFAGVAEDGYVHVNPLGDSVYLGACTEHPEWCTSKLIGIYSMLTKPDPAAPDADPMWGFKDLDGHGSHVASTVAGNGVSNVPIVDAEGKPSTGFSFAHLSGVAPRANIISYKVCAPSCATSAVVAAVEQAIDDGVVDVINHSIGSETGSPWRATKSLAFLAAREAGIFVASAAGNEGPGAATGAYVGSAPWTAGVAATTHDRSFPGKGLVDLTGGDTTPPTGITGSGVTGGFTGRVVYAGNFPVGVAGEPNFDNPRLCLAPFPAGTFAPDMIVICDRGTNALVDKGKAVRDGGAGGLIISNVTGGATSLNALAHVIPALHVNVTHGTALKTWVATGTGHVATIEPSPPAGVAPAVADIMASFSSRGPYTGFDFLGPRIAAPGADIFAADAATGTLGLFGFKSGTSMASPHLAGVATLLKAVRPEWTNAEALSALMTTATTAVRKENGVTPADVHDVGAGRVRLDVAVRAGLLLDETPAGFRAGDPELGGDPGNMNVAELVRQSCVVECGWKRTVKATVAGTWTVTASPYITVTPAEFTLAAGATQELTLAVDARTLALGTYAFGQVELTPADKSLPTQHIPTVVRPKASDIPADKNLVATRTQGSGAIRGLHAVDIEQLSFKVSGMGIAQQEHFELAQDSDLTSAYDDVTDGVVMKTVPFPDGAEQVIVEITQTDSQDLDLRVGVDKNGDGLPSTDEQMCVSATGAAIERCVLNLGGTVTAQPPLWIVIQNYLSSEPEAVDSLTLALTTVGTADAGNLIPVGPTGPIPAATPWDLELHWQSPPNLGDIAYGKVQIYSKVEQSAATLLGTVNVRLVRAADDVAIALPALAKTSEAFPVKLTVGPNHEQVARNYEITIPLPAGVSHVAGSGGTRRGNAVVLQATTPAGSTASTELGFQVRAARSLGGQSLTLTATNTVDNPHSIAESASASVKLSRYAFSGFLFPTPPNSTVIIGLPVLLRFQVRDAATHGALRGLTIGVQVTDSAGAVVLNENTNGAFLDDYLHFFGTSGWAPGKYTVTVTLDDGTSYSMPLNLRRLFGR